jgi:hypothetical protein
LPIRRCSVYSFDIAMRNNRINSIINISPVINVIVVVVIIAL